MKKLLFLCFLLIISIGTIKSQSLEGSEIEPIELDSQKVIDPDTNLRVPDDDKISVPCFSFKVKVINREGRRVPGCMVSLWQYGTKIETKARFKWELPDDMDTTVRIYPIGVIAYIQVSNDQGLCVNNYFENGIVKDTELIYVIDECN